MEEKIEEKTFAIRDILPDIAGREASPGCPDLTLETLSKVYNEADGDLTGYDCRKCKNKGYVSVVTGGREFFQPCECLAIRDEARLREESGYAKILEKYRPDNFLADTPLHKRMKLIAEKFANCGESTCLYVGGVPGTGKSHMCCAVVNMLIARRRAVKFMDWKSDSTEIKGAAGTPQYSTMVDDFKKAGVLYIDDFLRGVVSEGDRNLAFLLINYRYNNDLMTIISSEKPWNELRIEDRAIADRIWEMARGYVMTLRPGATNMRIERGEEA